MPSGDIVFHNGQYFYNTGLGLNLFALGKGVMDVTFTGAKGDGVTDDTPAILLAVAELKARGGGICYFPKPAVEYIVRPQDYSYRATFGYRAGAITIDFSNVSFIGDAGGSRLRLKTPTGGSAVNNDYVLTPPWATDAGTGSPPLYQAGHAYGDGDQAVMPNGHTYFVRGGGAGISGGNPPNDLSHTADNLIDGTVHWSLGDVPYFGQMFRIRNEGSNPSKNIVFKSLIFDGDGKRNNTLFPYSVNPVASSALAYDYVHSLFGPIPAGQGWAAGHSAVAMDQLSQYGKVTFEDCEFHNWRSEIYRSDYGAPFADTITFRRCWFNSMTGNAISCASPLLAEKVLITDTSQGIENDAVNFDQSYSEITIQDGGVGIVFPSSANTYLGRGQTVIRDFLCQRLTGSGLFVSGFATNIYAQRGQIVDCATVPGYSAVQVVPQFGGIPTNVVLDDVTVGVDTRSTQFAFNLSVRGGRNRASRCRVHLTETAIAASQFIGGAFGGTVEAGSELLVDSCDYRGAVGQGNIGGAGEARILSSRADGLYQDLSPNLDPQWFDYYEMQPAGARTLTTPVNFPYATEVCLKLSTLVTVQNNASITLAGGVNFTPGANGAFIWFKRRSTANQNVVETRRQAL